MAVYSFSNACPEWIIDARAETRQSIAAFTPDQLRHYAEDSRQKVTRYWPKLETSNPDLWKKIHEDPTLITQKELIELREKDKYLAFNLVVLGVYHDALASEPEEATKPAVKPSTGLSLVHSVPR